jgi:hypothetical protein
MLIAAFLSLSTIMHSNPAHTLTPDKNTTKGTNSHMKYFTKNHVLVDSQNVLIKELSCPAQKRWSQLIDDADETTIPSRYCDGCDKRVYDISGLDESRTKSFVSENQSPCIYIDFRRSDIELVNVFSKQSDFFKAFADNPDFIKWHTSEMNAKKQAYRCVDDAPNNLVRTTSDVDTIKDFLLKGYRVQIISCAPTEDRFNKQWLRYDDSSGDISVIDSEANYNSHTDHLLPIKAYLIPPHIEPGDRVFIRQFIHPFHAKHFYTNPEFNAAAPLDIDDDNDAIFTPANEGYLSLLPTGSWTQVEIEKDLAASWEGQRIVFNQQEGAVVFTLKTLAAMQWALTQGYRLQIESAAGITDSTEQWLRYDDETQNLSIISHEKETNTQDISLPAAAYVIPKSIREGDRVYVTDIIERRIKEQYGLENYQETIYHESGEGVFRNGRIELALPPPIEVIG